MKKCSDCNSEIKDGAKFCGACGKAVGLLPELLPDCEEPICKSLQTADGSISLDCCAAPKIKKHILLAAYVQCAWEMLSKKISSNRLSDPKHRETFILRKPEAMDSHDPCDQTQENNIPSIVDRLKAKLDLMKSITEEHRNNLLHVVARKKVSSDVSCHKQSKVSRMLIIATVTGVTAVSASFGLSLFLMNDKTPAFENRSTQLHQVSTNETSNTTTAVVNQSVDLQNPSKPIASINQSNSVDTGGASSMVASQPKIQSTNSNQVDGVDQPMKKKQTSNQQDLNRKRLLELKRQLGQ